MTYACLSDLHGHVPPLERVPQTDRLIIAGDLCPDNRWTRVNPEKCRVTQEAWLKSALTPWLKSLDRPCYFIWGNHDWARVWDSPLAMELRSGHVYYDHGVSIAGESLVCLPKSWGWTTCVESDTQLAAQWAKLPVPAPDILVTHGPPRDCGDACPTPVGSESLRTWTAAHPPMFHIFGHIHEGRGSYGSGRMNVSYVDALYQPYQLRIPVIETRRT